MEDDTIIERPVLVLTGPTAIGKTELSLNLALTFNCEIISVDSMQVYRLMDIGTAKVSVKERSRVPHHLVDILNPDQEYSAAQFATDALDRINEIHERSRVPLLTGGTGLYFKALKKGLFKNAPADEELRNKLVARGEIDGYDKLHEELIICDRLSGIKIHENDKYRIVRALEVFHSTGVPLSEHIALQQSHESRFSKLFTIGLTCDRQRLYQRINERTLFMLEQGLEDEVNSLLEKGYARDLKSMQSIGYRHMLNYIFNDWSYDEMEEKLARDTRRYAKRQYTWFNNDASIQWFDHLEHQKIAGAVDHFLNP